MENQKLEASVLSAVADFKIEMEKLFGKQIAFSIEIKGVPLSKIAIIAENNDECGIIHSMDIFKKNYSYINNESIDGVDLTISSRNFKKEIPYSVAFGAEPGDSLHNDEY